MASFKFSWTFLQLSFSIFFMFCFPRFIFANLFEFVFHNSAWSCLHVIYLYILKSVNIFKQRANILCLCYFCFWSIKNENINTLMLLSFFSHYIIERTIHGEFKWRGCWRKFVILEYSNLGIRIPCQGLWCLLYLSVYCTRLKLNNIWGNSF